MTERKRSKPEYLIIGQILSPWGVKGEVKVEIITDFPDRFALLEQVYLGEKRIPYKLEKSRRYKRWVLLKFAGVDDRSTAEALRGLYIEIPIDQAMPLGEDEFYEHQIIGLEVWTTEGQYLGYVTEVIFTGSNEVYVVENETEEILIPALKEVVPEIDLDKERMTVRLIEGLPRNTRSR